MGEIESMTTGQETKVSVVRKTNEIMDIGQWLQEKSSDMIEALARLIRHPSFSRKDDSKAPFGKAIDACLDEVLIIANQLGLRTYKDPDGYYGYAELGYGQELVGILCHLDVPDAGDVSGWFSSPFDLELRNGVLYGLGCQRSKGPLVSVLYALKALQNSACPLKHTIRLIIGCDAESGWRCAKNYLDREVLPVLSLAPMVSSPVVHAEKRLVQVYLYGPPSSKLHLTCGGELELVPDRAIYRGKRQKQLQRYLDSHGLPWLQDADATVVLGQRASAADCDREGVNAIVRLCRALQGIGYQHPALGFCGLIIGDDPHVRALFGDMEDVESGKLTVNLASLSMNEQSSCVGLDIRVPVSVDFTLFEHQLNHAASRLGWRYELHEHLDPLYVSPSAPLIQLLCDSYESVVGEDCRSEASGHVSYARALPNCLPLGVRAETGRQLPNQPNEHIDLDSLLLNSRLLFETLSSLQHLTLDTALGRNQ